MQVGTWVQFERDSSPLGYIISKQDLEYKVKVTNTKVGWPTLAFSVDGYATEYERKNKINRIIEFRA